MSVILSASLFFLSFFPLWVSVIFIDGMSIADGTANTWTEIISICIILLSMILALFVVTGSLNPRNRAGTQPYVLTEVHEEKAITAEYLLAYILPLFAFDFTLWRQMTLFLIFFATLGFLCIRHNYFSVNLILELRGYRFYRCVLENEDGIPISKVIVSKEPLNRHITETILLRALNNEYLFFIKM